MARKRTTAAELAKLLGGVNRPIYVLDGDWTLIFCNQACLDWIGRTADEMQGLRCAYHSSPEVTEAEAAAAGLCPPPDALGREETVGTVASIAEGGPPRRRRARFIPLGATPEERSGLVTLVDCRDLPEVEVASEEPDQTEAVRLHERMRVFRRQAAADLNIDRLAGESAAVRRARRQAALAATSSASVLVVGPPGSGRQRLAAAIHYGGDPESTGSLIPLACSLLGAELIHSTVAALAGKHGSRRESLRGTLLLNDVDLLGSEVQADLAANLVSRSFPLRRIATARQPLEELARRGEYREDLASALSTIVIELPELARRREDLPLLGQLFVEEANVRSEKQVTGFTSETLDRLDAYPWPGNVDELAQVVAQAHARAEGPRITPGDLPERIHLAAEAAARPPRKEETIVLDAFLGRIERELLRRALARAKGNKTQAAKLLGMSRPRLYRRLEQLDLE